LEVKALWNGTENACAWYAMGADGLKKKIEHGCANKRVGFTEIRSRFGVKFNNIYPETSEEAKNFWLQEAAAIISVNLPQLPPMERQKLLLKANGSNRVLRTQILKLKRKQNENGNSETHTGKAAV
jgi:hypothetical protein